jgi:tyrosyl-tRNA synthetase
MVADRLQDTLSAFRRVAQFPDAAMEAELARKLERAGPGGLRVKLGLDPSSPDLHVGHAVLLLLLRDLQALGHTVVLIVGDTTARLGDPSGRNKLRPQLTRAEVDENLATYTEQAGILLDMQRVEVRRNGEWFDRMGFDDLLKLLGRRTVAQTLTREDFQKRMAADVPIGMHELVYPLLQGWDSVEVRADVELGGTDQLFNLLVGRDFQVQEGQAPQVIAMTPLINGLDGRKMSKSYDNAIGLTDPPAEVFGKTMRIVDEAMELWFRLLTRLAPEEIATLLAGPHRDAKARLGWELVRLLHGAPAADEAQAGFDRLFRQKEVPDDVPEHDWPLGEQTSVPLPQLLRALGLATTNSDGRRKVEQGGVRIDGEVVRDPHHSVARGQALLLQVGKRHFARLRG